MPLFYKNDDGTNNWKTGIDYESLIIVTYNNSLYISNKAVPDTVGNPAENSSYWVKLSSSYQDIGDLQTKVSELERNFKTLNSDTTEIKQDISEIKSSLQTLNQNVTQLTSTVESMNTTLSDKIDSVNDNVLFQISTLIEQFYPDISSIIGG